jgi:hypothetical protein
MTRIVSEGADNIKFMFENLKEERVREIRPR